MYLGPWIAPWIGATGFRWPFAGPVFDVLLLSKVLVALGANSQNCSLGRNLRYRRLTWPKQQGMRSPLRCGLRGWNFVRNWCCRHL
jgi:hypothetical protein